MKKQLDLVVVGFTGELKMLQLQARSLRLFAPDVFSQILYIVNDRSPERFLQFYEDRILPELGPLAARTRVVDGREIAGQKLKRTDWRSQQSLKLLAARHTLSPNYLILDSKNHLIRPVGRQTFVTDDGRLRTHRYDFNEKFMIKFENACRYFGIDAPAPGFAALPTATPFMMSAEIARHLMLEVEAKEKKSFHSFFTGSKDYTEFYFYFAYVLSKTGLLDRTYVTRSRPQVTLFRSAAEDLARVKALLPILDREDVYCFGVHRALLLAANEPTLKAVSDVWRRFGLVDNADEVTYFQTPDESPKPQPGKRRFWLF